MRSTRFAVRALSTPLAFLLFLAQAAAPTGFSPGFLDADSAALLAKPDPRSVEARVEYSLLVAARAAKSRVAQGETAWLPVTVRATDASWLGDALRGRGAREVTPFPAFGLVTAIVPATDVLDFAGLDGVVSMSSREGAVSDTAPSVADLTIDRKSASSLSKAGAVQWPGVAAHEANVAHQANIRGAGVKVCVLADGVDGLAAQVSAGELPAVTILTGQQGTGSRGTAMLEVIHDMAPAAELFFATSSGGVAQFATNILNLRAAYGCAVMVDGTTYLNEPAFQDGPVAQAVNAVSAQSGSLAPAIYVAGSGDSGNVTRSTSGTFEGTFAEGGTVPPVIQQFYPAAVKLHSFGGAGFTVLTGATRNVSLKWSDPLGKSANDYDLFVLNADSTAILGSSLSSQLGTQDPYELATCSGTDCTFPVNSRVYIVRYSGADRIVRLDTHGGRIANGTERATYGHGAAQAAVTVAGVSLASANGGAFVGGSTNPVSTASSDGPRRMVAYDPANLLATPTVTDLTKPDAAAGEGGATASAPAFSGSAAAAATAAGMFALARSVNTAISAEDLKAAFKASTLPRGSGLERDLGGGIVMVPLLLARVPGSSPVASTTPSAASFGNQPVGAASAAQTVTLANTGGGSLTISSVSSSNAQFAVSQSCTALAGGATCPVTVTFTPSALGTRTGTLTIATNGGTRTVELSGVGVGSQNFNANVNAVVTGYYETILGRSPDAAGLTFWSGEAARVSQLGADVREVFYAMAMQFFASPEYVARGTPNEQYVRDLYQTFFSRQPDQAGLAYWVGELAVVGSRSALLNSFLFSPEYANTLTGLFGNPNVRPEVNLTMDLFRGVFGRLPDNGGYTFWRDQLRAAQCQGASAVNAKVTEIANTFFGSNEYAQRARVDRDFMGDVYNTYLRRGPGGDAVGFNYWVGQIAERGRDGVRAAFVPSTEFQARVTAIVAAGCL